LTVPHSWLDNGCVLRLEGNTDTSAAVDLFQEIWSRGQPVVVTNATKSLNINKWYPNGLNDDFGDEQVELIDVKTGNSLGEHSLKRFLDGYNTVLKRPKDENGKPVVARIFGWPGSSGDEFKDILPDRSSEFLEVLPVPCYTGRAAPLNLAASLPDTFARAEVGPRAFITYGDVSDTKPSTALLVERADSVIVCVHAQIPKNDDLDPEEFRAKAVKIMETLGCDTASIKQNSNKTPAAIWTIFHPSDGDKIRDLLNKISSKDQDQKRPLNYDPFLEENVVLDDLLTKRLKDEYDVKPYVITQFQGEAIFIPAGSPRQVKHLQSVISLESDFVSPENVSQSFFMYRQLRHLCDSQKQPIVDKLSVKNLIFHSVKNAVATLERSKSSNGNNDESENEENDAKSDKTE